MGDITDLAKLERIAMEGFRDLGELDLFAEELPGRFIAVAVTCASTAFSSSTAF
jgi:hypothetical protein